MENTLKYFQRRCKDLKMCLDTCRDKEGLEKVIAHNEKAVEALEELEIAKEAIRKLLCNEYGSSCQFCIHNDNENAMCRKVGGSGAWCCENAAWNRQSD